MNARQALMLIKNKPVDERVFIAFEERDIIRLMSSWELCFIRFDPPENELPEGGDFWSWVWKDCFFSNQKLINLFGREIPPGLLYTCMRSGMIFPDGTSNFDAIIKRRKDEEDKISAIKAALE